MKKQESKPIKSREFRAELGKIMPGYKWTVHRSLAAFFMEATGIKSAGLNRISTLRVCRIEEAGTVEYEVKSAGFGCHSPWLHENTDGTLARALRGLQDHYETMANEYSSHAHHLQSSRKNGN